METIRGVYCLLSGGEFDLDRVFRGIDLCRYELCSYAMWMKGMVIATLDGELTMSELTDKLSGYTVEELSVHVFPKGASPRKPDDYADYLRSECVCSLMYYDCGYLEVYAKDREWTAAITENLARMRHDELSHITPENDGRESFF